MFAPIARKYDPVEEQTMHVMKQEEYVLGLADSIEHSVEKCHLNGDIGHRWRAALTIVML